MKAKPKAAGPGVGPVEAPVEEPGSFIVSAEDMEAYEEWQRIRSEFGEDEGKVILKRRNAKGQLAMLDIMSVADFSIDRVMQDWGGGRYIAAAFKNQAKMGQIQFEIDESIPKRTPIKETPQSQAVATVHGPASEDPRIAALERSIRSQDDLMKTLITAIVSKQGNGSGESALEMGLKIAEMINQRTPAAEKPSFADLKDIFLAGIEAKQAAEGGGEEEGYMPVLKAFAGPIAKVLDQAVTHDRSRMVAAGSVPVQPHAPLPAAAPPPALPPGLGWLIHLQPHLPTLLGWAKAGKDPDLYAEVILDNIEPGAQMEIAQATQDPEFVSKTLAALPMFVPYSAWATAVLTNMKELLLAPPESEGGGDSAQE